MYVCFVFALNGMAINRLRNEFGLEEVWSLLEVGTYCVRLEYSKHTSESHVNVTWALSILVAITVKLC